jgi:hypothetical protein
MPLHHPIQAKLSKSQMQYKGMTRSAALKALVDPTYLSRSLSQTFFPHCIWWVSIKIAQSVVEAVL